ncbi:MAG: ATP synthase F0 subunit B [Byssovorax sp.]
MKSPRKHGIAAIVGLGAGLVLLVGSAVAQPRPGPPPNAQIIQPGQPAPPSQPGQVQIRKIDPSQLPPGFRQPGGPLAPGGPTPPGGPGGPGGTRSPFPPGMRQPGLPPGFNPRPAVPVAAHHEEAEEEGGGEHEWCPGFGPTDPPRAPNWWQGLLMVDNERAKKDDFLDKLLFRYENKKDACDKDNMAPPYLATVINFAILAFILYRFGRKPLAEALLKRKTTIMADIETATKLKDDAERRLTEYEEKFERMDEKLAELRRELAAQSEKEKAHILAEAEERRVRMRRDAEFRIDQEAKTARAELLQQAVIGAAAAAEELLVKKVGPSDLDRMAEDYLKAVGPAIQGPRVGAAAPGVR